MVKTATHSVATSEIQNRNVMRPGIVLTSRCKLPEAITLVNGELPGRVKLMQPLLELDVQ
jgi:hypothetical protein